MDHETWRTELDGDLSVEVRDLKLIVRRSDACARYVILQRGRSGGMCAEVMLSSGTEANVEAAMVAAKRVATSDRLHARRAEQPYGGSEWTAIFIFSSLRMNRSSWKSCRWPERPTTSS